MNKISSLTATKVSSFPVAIVVSLFNYEITSALKEGAVQRLLERGVQEADILLVEVPGAIEIPVTAAIIAKHKTPKAILVLGSVIRGETDHYDCVFDQINYGCQRVALDYQIPVIFEVLMTDNEEQAFDRLGGSHGHKGVSAADCAIDMVNILTTIKTQQEISHVIPKHREGSPEYNIEMKDGDPSSQAPQDDVGIHHNKIGHELNE